MYETDFGKVDLNVQNVVVDHLVMLEDLKSNRYKTVCGMRSLNDEISSLDKAISIAMSDNDVLAVDLLSVRKAILERSLVTYEVYSKMYADVIKMMCFSDISNTMISKQESPDNTVPIERSWTTCPLSTDFSIGDISTDVVPNEVEDHEKRSPTK